MILSPVSLNLSSSPASYVSSHHLNGSESGNLGFIRVTFESLTSQLLPSSESSCQSCSESPSNAIQVIVSFSAPSTCALHCCRSLGGVATQPRLMQWPDKQLPMARAGGGDAAPAWLTQRGALGAQAAAMPDDATDLSSAEAPGPWRHSDPAGRPRWLIIFFCQGGVIQRRIFRCNAARRAARCRASSRGPLAREPHCYHTLFSTQVK